MKTIAAIILLSCCALAQDKTAISTAESACGPQDAKFEVRSDKSQHPAPTPEEGKALIHFIADGHLTTPMGVDGKWGWRRQRWKVFLRASRARRASSLRDAAIVSCPESAHSAR